MGARVYIPELGRFLQVDPVEGGTDNNYVYANDPVNEFDLDGRAIPILFLFGNVARIAAPHIARAAVKYIAKPVAKFAAKRAVPLLKKGAGHVARWGVNRWNKVPKIRVNIKFSRPNHWWPHRRGIGGKGWYKHVEINIRFINQSTGKVTRFIHKQIKYGRAYKYKHGRYGTKL